MKVRKAVIPAAGFGTRVLPATKALPKEMLPIVDKPSLQYLVEELVESGIQEILIINGRNKVAIEDHFDKSPELEVALEKSGKFELLEQVRAVPEMANIHFVRQKETKGLGHAISCAKAFVGNEPFAILLGDDIVRNDVPCIKQLMDAHEKFGCSVVGVQTIDRSQVDKYGIVDGIKIDDKNYEVKDMIEKPSIEESPSNIAMLGRYILTPAIFDILEKTKPGKGGEIQLTDGMRTLIEKEKLIAHDFSGKRYDIGNKFGYVKAQVEFALEHPEIKDVFKEYLKELKLNL